MFCRGSPNPAGLNGSGREFRCSLTSTVLGVLSTFSFSVLTTLLEAESHCKGQETGLDSLRKEGPSLGLSSALLQSSQCTSSFQREAAIRLVRLASRQRQSTAWMNLTGWTRLSSPLLRASCCNLPGLPGVRKRPSTSWVYSHHSLCLPQPLSPLKLRRRPFLLQNGSN